MAPILELAKPTLNVGCGPDSWGDIRVDVDFRTQTGTLSKLNVRADAHFLPFIDKAFSLVRCWHVLEHLRDPNLALGEIRRVGVSGNVRFPVGDGFKRELMRNALALTSYGQWRVGVNGMKLAYQTRRRRLHLWVLKPAGSSAHRNSFVLFPFLLSGRKSRLFRKIRIPSVAWEWEATI